MRRELLIAANAAAIAALVPVAARQLGLIDHLPDPPCSGFDSDGIVTSRAAHPLGVPDSLPGIASYSATLALVLLERRHRTLRPLLMGKLALDGAAAAFNAGRQVVRFRKLCSWCTATSVWTAVMLYAALSKQDA